MARNLKTVELRGDEIQIVSFKLGEESYAIEVSQVREIVKLEKITKVPKMPDFIEGMLNLRGQITTVVDMRKRFHMESIERDTQSKIIIGEIDKFKIGMIVDSVSNVLRVSPDNIMPPPDMLSNNLDTNYLKGICKLPEGLIMLLDLRKIMSEGEMVQMDKFQLDKQLSGPSPKNQIKE